MAVWPVSRFWGWIGFFLVIVIVIAVVFIVHFHILVVVFKIYQNLRLKHLLARHTPSRNRRTGGYLVISIHTVGQSWDHTSYWEKHAWDLSIGLKSSYVADFRRLRPFQKLVALAGISWCECIRTIWYSCGMYVHTYTLCILQQRWSRE